MCVGRTVSISFGSLMPCGRTFSIRYRKWRKQSTILVAPRAIAVFSTVWRVRRSARGGIGELRDSGTRGYNMGDGDFEPEGWSAFDDHGAHGEKGNAGCAFAILAVVIIATIGKLAGC